MQAQNYFQLIGPLILLVLSFGFTVIWHFARDVVPVRLFALAFFLGAAGAFADYMRDAMPLAVALYVINILYVATAQVFISGLFYYYAERIPWSFAVAAATAMLASLSWFILVHDDIVGRIIVMNVGNAVTIMMPALVLRRQMNRPIDSILQVTLLVIGACIGARAGFVIVTGGEGLTNENYASSLIALSLHFTIALSALAVAIVLFVLVGMEIVNRLTTTSETDPLTGVLNRRGYDSRIGSFAARIAAGGAGHAVVMADIDGFKSVNDRYGHEAGDAVIRKFARILAGTARDRDLVVRWGGEEFLIVIANADIATASLFAEAVRTVFAEIAHDQLDGASVTASFGIAAWRRGHTVAGVAHLADKALYRAKREGRNRVCVFGAESPGALKEMAVA
ncbi:MAG: GGDEF domain-containing protein [Oricola sp.]